MDPKTSFTSKLFDFEEVDLEDELDLELTRLYTEYREAVKEKSEIELHNYLQDKASVNENNLFQCLSFVNRDNFAAVLSKLHYLAIHIKFQQIKFGVKEQMFWLISELTSLNVQSIDNIYLCLLRQIKGGDITQPNILLCEQMLKLLITRRAWLDMYPRVIATVVYTFLRLIPDHRPTHLSGLQEKEVRFVVGLLREKWVACCSIGRDLIRALQDVSSIPEIGQLWDDMLNVPERLSPRFKGIDTILKQPTPKEYLWCRLTPDIEAKLLYILQNLPLGHYQRNLGWFLQRYLNGPESEPFFVDVIRFIVSGWYPSNQILQSDIVPRYVVIGSMLRAIKTDINLITPLEPAMLLMERSAERYPYISSIIMEFLKLSVDEYYPPMKDYMARCVSCGMQTMLSKGVIRSLMPIYKCLSQDDVTRECMRSLFGAFLKQDAASGIPIPQTQLLLETRPQRPPTNNDKVEESMLAEFSIPEITRQTDIIDQEEGEGEEGEIINDERPMDEGDDDDVDRYLYGDTEKEKEKLAEPSEKGETQAERGDVWDDDIFKDDTQLPEVAAVPQSADTTEDTTMGEVHLTEDAKEMPAEEPMNISRSDDVKELVENDKRHMDPVAAEKALEWHEGANSDAENEEECEDNEQATERMQSNQSYWIFGDALKRFQLSCSVVNAGKTGDNGEEYEAQMLRTKHSLKEILSVYLRMAIPAETLAPNVAPQIRSIASRLLLEHSHVVFEDEPTEDSVIQNSQNDPFDLLMVTFWNVKNTAALRDKMVRLIGCITHSSKKGRRHLVGMRWWMHIACRLDLQSKCGVISQESMKEIMGCYETFVGQGCGVDIERDHYIKQYIVEDLRMLAEHNILLFHTVVPWIYRLLPEMAIGNVDLLKIVVTMALPDQVGELVCMIHYGTIRLFGDSIDADFLMSSLEMNPFEVMSMWQIVAAELQGHPERVDVFFSTPDILRVFQAKLRSEIMPPLLAVLASIQPTKKLIEALVQITSTEKQGLDVKWQFVTAALNYWATITRESLQRCLSELVSSLLDAAESETDESNEEISQISSQVIKTLQTWWAPPYRCKETEIFSNDRNLLAKLSRLGIMVGQSCPKEWTQEARRKKRSIVLDLDDSE
ncbi:Integrator complex subunit 3 [Apophysomyces sp. BC1034]|nr:Integrator complex subunit 3 [Apophysomyces sp. BC1034]